MKDRSNDPSHHERTLVPRSYISLHQRTGRQAIQVTNPAYPSTGCRQMDLGLSMSPHEGSIRRPIAPWANALTTELHLAPPKDWEASHTGNNHSVPEHRVQTDGPRLVHVPPHEGSIQRPITPWANALTTELHLAPPKDWEASHTGNNHRRTRAQGADRWTSACPCPPHEGSIRRPIAPWANALTT